MPLVVGGTFVGAEDLCPDCNMRAARPRAKGRRCNPCAKRHLYLTNAETRERTKERSRTRMRKESAERKEAGPQFFAPPPES